MFVVGAAGYGLAMAIDHSLDYGAHLRADAARFADVLRDADPSATVPTCPDWNTDDLLWHVAEVFTFWGTIVRDRLDDPGPAGAAEPARPADHAGLLALYDGAVTALIAALADADDDVPVWTWSGDNRVGFVRRRMAQEALIHRLDAELIAGQVTDVDAELAADGVHELLQHVLGGYPDWATYRAGGAVGRLRATDTGGKWIFEVGGFSGLSPNSGKSYDDEPTFQLIDTGEPTFTVSGSARDLDAWLWNRPPLVLPTIEGDRADYDRFAAIIAKGVE
jgi:uncharacterized protein (TIGR03083 family)